MMCPSGMRMLSVFDAILLSTHGLFDFKKCPDVPESAAARLSSYLCVIVFVVPMIFIWLSTNLSHTRRHLYQYFYHSLPPIVLSLVAVVMCLFFCFSQVLLLCPFATLKPWLQQQPSFSMVVMSLVPVGLVVERLGLVPVLASFEVSVAMDDCTSASFMFACPS